MPGGLTLLASASVDIPTPAAGKVTVFFDLGTLLPSYKNDVGIVLPLTGPQGIQGPSGIQGEQGDEGEVPIALAGPQGNPGPTGPQGPTGPMMLQEEPLHEDVIPSAIYIPKLGEFWDYEIIKKNNTTVTNSAAYVEDAELRYLLAASGVYLVEAEIVFSANSTAGDYKWEWRMGAEVASANQWAGYWMNFSGPTFEGGSNNTPNCFWGNLNLAMPVNVHEKFVMHQRFGLTVPATTASDFLLVYRFAQVTATAATDAITYAGSRFRIKKLN